MSGFRDFAKEQTNLPRNKRGNRGTALAWNADSATECVEDSLHHFTCFVLFKCECVTAEVDYKPDCQKISIYNFASHIEGFNPRIAYRELPVHRP